ncbi:hypothetical protein V495_06031 [Pseudogymnoascus sp. VKM F-4514 (FW-929)]|nr:hypothetical protein V495_06031 [Pseudogymnoascus sp. VKM F-4514 (FW-929)]
MLSANGCRSSEAKKRRSGNSGGTYAITEQILYHNRVKVACCCSVSFASTLVHLGEPDPLEANPRHHKGYPVSRLTARPWSGLEPSIHAWPVSSEISA